MQEYHDQEWGTPLHDDRALFELLVLEGAQAGLSWSTILRKRAGYHAAFQGFDPARVARYGAPQVARLMNDPAIVRNRLKIQATITNAQGIYRFPGLPAGTYRLTFEMPGFRTVNRDGIRIGIGFTANVNPTLSVKQMQEETTVTGESPTIDTTATRVQTNFDKSTLESLPNARDMWSLLSETPAVTLNRFDVGGSTAGTQTTYVAYGNGGQNRPLIGTLNCRHRRTMAGLPLGRGDSFFAYSDADV